MATLTYTLTTGYESMTIWDSIGGLGLDGAKQIRLGRAVPPAFPTAILEVKVRGPQGKIYVTDVDHAGIYLKTLWKTYTVPVTAINGHKTLEVTDFTWNKLNVGLAIGIPAIIGIIFVGRRKK